MHAFLISSANARELMAPKSLLLVAVGGNDVKEPLLDQFSMPANFTTHIMGMDLKAKLELSSSTRGDMGVERELRLGHGWR